MGPDRERWRRRSRRRIGWTIFYRRLRRRGIQVGLDFSKNGRVVAGSWAGLLCGGDVVGRAEEGRAAAEHWLDEQLAICGRCSHHAVAQRDVVAARTDFDRDGGRVAA